MPLRPGADLAPGSAVTVGLRPESLTPTDGAGIPGTVRLVELLGRETILYVDAGPVRSVGSDTGTANLTVHVASAIAAPAGAAVRLSFNPDDAYLFGGDGLRTLSAPKSI